MVARPQRVLSVVFGILLAVWPTAGALTVIFLIGAYSIVFGGVLIGLGLHLRRLHEGSAASGVHRPATT